MAVVSVHTWRPVPGRAMDLVASMAQAKTILEANGAVVSLWQPLAGGQAGSIDFVAAYSDVAAYGATMQSVAASGDWQTYWTAAMADPSGVNLENVLMSDLDPSEGLPVTPSKVLAVATFKTRPGRLTDHLASQDKARGHLERLGGQVRTVQTIGRNPGSFTTLIGFEDFAHYGEFASKFAIDEQWAAFWLDVASDPSAEEIESRLSTQLEIPA
jgi:hypothetical protein